MIQEETVLWVVLRCGYWISVVMTILSRRHVSNAKRLLIVKEQLQNLVPGNARKSYDAQPQRCDQHAILLYR